MNITEELFQLQEQAYGDFQSKLTPDIDRDKFIGVRTPLLRTLAKKVYKAGDFEGFLQELPHRYFEENQLHAFLISERKDFEACLWEVERFLPYVDNWATCDQLLPVAFKKEPERLLPYIKEWIQSEQTYTVRFAIGCLMRYFLDEKFELMFVKMVAMVRSREYYINMMIAWYMATALAKQYESALPVLERKELSVWVHNKSIQKAVESYRITDGQKEYLKSLRIRSVRKREK